MSLDPYELINWHNSNVSIKRVQYFIEQIRDRQSIIRNRSKANPVTATFDGITYSAWFESGQIVIKSDIGTEFRFTSDV